MTLAHRQRFARLLALAFPVVLGCWGAPALAVAQEPSSEGGDLAGETFTGEGVTESVADIMAREARRLPQGALVIREKPKHGLTGPRQPNPDAPAVGQWPPVSTDDGQSIPSPQRAPSPNLPQAAGTSFQAIQLSESGFIPPDSMGAVGPTQILAVANGRIKVFDKAGTLGGLNTTTDNFFASVGGTTLGTTDPHIRYDRLSGRFFVVAITVNTCPNAILIAVSSGPTISDASAFTFFSLAAGTAFLDYPTLGVDANALYIGGNIFTCPAFGFSSVHAYVVRKAALLTGSVIATRFVDLHTAGIWTPQGVDNDEPLATEGYFIGVDFNVFSRLGIRRVSTPGGVPTLSAQLNVTVPVTASPINQPQPNAGPTLDALDDRLFAAAIRRNKVTSAVTLWTAHNIQVNSTGVGSSTGGRNGARWYEIGNMTGTPTLVQSGTLFDGSATTPFGYWIPSVMGSGQGHMAIGSSRASVSPVDGYASVVAAGRLRTDVLGTTQAPTLVQGSTFNYDVTGGPPERWGDYSQTVVDPTDDQTMWTFQEYANATNSWAVRVAQLRAPPPATPAAASPATVPQGQASVSVVITGASTAGSEFFDPGPDPGGPGFAQHISATVTPGVIVNSVTFDTPTQVTLDISTVGAATGLKTVRITNPDGQNREGAVLTISGGCPVITVNPGSVPSGTIGTAYSQTFTQTGGTAPVTFSQAGPVPTGVTFNPGTATLSGTPTQTGTFNFTVTATDANACTGSRAYTLDVACQAITVQPNTIPAGTMGSPYSQTFTQAGAIGTVTWSLIGTLPLELNLDSATGVLSGTPTETGSFPITVEGKDANGCFGGRAYTLVINTFPPPADFYTLIPCRLVDTRNADGPTGGPILGAGSTRSFPVIGGACGVPSTALAVSVNLTAAQAATVGHLILFAGDSLDPPLVSTVNFTAGVNRANNAIVPLARDGTGTIQVKNGSAGSVHFVLDVNGYFQ